jgi:tryptophan-rich sensory protein
LNRSEETFGGRAADEPEAASPRLLSGVKLGVWVLAIMAAGAAASLLFPPGDWYQQLAKPTWNPPSWLFGPVWALMYVLLGVGAWLVWRERRVPAQERRDALIAFALHAVLNLAWTPLFFGLQRPGLAFLDICLLWLALLWMTLRFGRIVPLAGYLQTPMILWVSFALVLNGTIWLMNA